MLTGENISHDSGCLTGATEWSVLIVSASLLLTLSQKSLVLYGSILRDRVSLLAPDIQKALLTGTAPEGLEPEILLSRDIPLDWDEQRKFLGFTKAS